MLVNDELQRRQDRLLERRRVQARFRDPSRSLDSFDFTFIKKMNRALLFELATGRFVTQREDLLLVGPPGTGKSHCKYSHVPLTCVARGGYRGGSGGWDDPKTHRPCGRRACLCLRYVSRPPRHRLYSLGLA